MEKDSELDRFFQFLIKDALGKNKSASYTIRLIGSFKYFAVIVLGFMRGNISDIVTTVSISTFIKSN